MSYSSSYLLELSRCPPFVVHISLDDTREQPANERDIVSRTQSAL